MTASRQEAVAAAIKAHGGFYSWDDGQGCYGWDMLDDYCECGADRVRWRVLQINDGAWIAKPETY